MNKEFSPNDIRPEEAEKRYMELYKKELKAMLDPDTGLVKASLLMERNCPVCSASTVEKTFVKDGFTFVKCSKCGLLYVNPTIKDSELENYYNCEALVFYEKNILLKTREIRNEKIFMPRVNLVEKYINEGKILDVGCAIGNFLECIVKNPKWEAFGVEPNDFAAGFAKENVDAKIYNCMLEDTDFSEESFDAITLWETVEHLQRPSGLLEYCFRLLKKDGFFFISTPNIGGFEFKIMGKEHFNIGAPNHLNYFDTKTLREILVRTGFQEIEIITPGRLDVENVRTLLKQGKGLDTAGLFIKDLLLSDHPDDEKIRRNLQEFISNNNLSGNMVAICKKL